MSLNEVEVGSFVIQAVGEGDRVLGLLSEYSNDICPMLITADHFDSAEEAKDTAVEFLASDSLEELADDLGLGRIIRLQIMKVTLAEVEELLVPSDKA